MLPDNATPRKLFPNVIASCPYYMLCIDKLPENPDHIQILEPDFSCSISANDF